MAGTARLSIEVVPDLSGLSAMADSFRDMAAAVEKMAESFRTVADHVERVARDRTPTRDAARWRPDCETGDDRTCTETCPLHG